jgi:hypothetical protein
MSDNTQYAHILYHMKKFGGLTSHEADVGYGITNIHKRVGELEDMGYKFDRPWEDGVNRYGKKTRYKRYYLTGEPEKNICAK